MLNFFYSNSKICRTGNIRSYMHHALVMIDDLRIGEGEIWEGEEIDGSGERREKGGKGNNGRESEIKGGKAK